MAPRYRVLALDLDGTTLNSTRVVSRKTKYWIKQAIDAGVIAICATGRGLPNAVNIWTNVFPGAPAVLANGAEVWLNPHTLLERHCLNPEDVLRLYELAQEVGGRFWAYNPEGMVKNIKLERAQLADGWYKFGISHRDPDAIAHVWEVASAWDSITVTSSHPSNVEISARGVSKRTGVERLCQELGISLADVMAIGDSHNDIELLRAVGLGVAMGNGSSEVKAVADKTTKSNQRNGVAWAIRKYLL